LEKTTGPSHSALPASAAIRPAHSLDENGWARMIKKNIVAKPINKKKPITLDSFAVLIQKDLSRMATKDDLWPMQRDIKTLTAQLKEVREDVKQITDNMVSKADLANILGDELAKSAYARQLHDLQTRVNLLEEKLGIKPTHRAA
jgi:hypothetical protein